MATLLQTMIWIRKTTKNSKKFFIEMNLPKGKQIDWIQLTKMCQILCFLQHLKSDTLQTNNFHKFCLHPITEHSMSISNLWKQREQSRRKQIFHAKIQISSATRAWMRHRRFWLIICHGQWRDYPSKYFLKMINNRYSTAKLLTKLEFKITKLAKSCKSSAKVLYHFSSDESKII